jgi:hypothetical protein
MASKYTEIVIARASLAAAHHRLFVVLNKIDAIYAEIGKQRVSAAEDKARVRKETEEWVKDNPREARAISELFFFSPSE